MSPPDTPERKHTQATETETSGKGMPAQEPQGDANRVGKPPTPQDASTESSLKLPHERDQSTGVASEAPAPERDQSTGAGSEKPRRRIEQALADESTGRKDTSKSLEMNDTYQKQKG